MHKYIYLFIRDDLTHPQQIIQAAHATELVAKTLPPNSPVCHMVLIGCKDLMQLESTAADLDFEGIAYKMFYEPDIGQHTAIATLPISGDARKLFKHYRLKR